MHDEERLEEPAEAGVDGEVEGGDGPAVSRRTFLAGAGVAGAGLLLGSAGGAAAKGFDTSAYNRHLGKRALSRGMVGGPTGFPGAARYQYPDNSAEGRAIAGLKRLTNNGQNPITLKFRIWNGAVGQLNKQYPTKNAPSVAQLPRILCAVAQEQAQQLGPDQTDLDRKRQPGDQPEVADRERAEGERGQPARARRIAR